MDRDKRGGIMLIVIGLIIPLAVLPLVSGFSIDKGFLDNFYGAGIRVRDSHNAVGPDPSPALEKGGSPKVRITWSSFIPHRIPFRLFLVPTVLLAYMGVIRIDRARRKKRES